MGFFNKVKKMQCIYLYIVMSMIMLAGTFACIFLGLTELERIISKDANFVDHFMHIAFASEPQNTYTFSYDACFPPLAYCFYYFLWKLNPVFVSDKLN